MAKRDQEMMWLGVYIRAAAHDKGGPEGTKFPSEQDVSFTCSSTLREIVRWGVVVGWLRRGLKLVEKQVGS